MKKFLSLTLCILMLFAFSACEEKAMTESKSPVVINLPKDNTVNGYRTEEPDISGNTVVSADSVAVDTSSKQNTDKQNNTVSGNATGAYCVNVNSGVFHKAECGSVSKMKEENKAYFNDRNQIVSQGYKPCGRCKP